jgi:hypothetical protein
LSRTSASEAVAKMMASLGADCLFPGRDQHLEQGDIRYGHGSAIGNPVQPVQLSAVGT